jgi:hypothetical protein
MIDRTENKAFGKKQPVTNAHRVPSVQQPQQTIGPLTDDADKTDSSTPPVTSIRPRPSQSTSVSGQTDTTAAVVQRYHKNAAIGSLVSSSVELGGHEPQHNDTDLVAESDTETNHEPIPRSADVSSTALSRSQLGSTLDSMKSGKKAAERAVVSNGDQHKADTSSLTTPNTSSRTKFTTRHRVADSQHQQSVTDSHKVPPSTDTSATGEYQQSGMREVPAADPTPEQKAVEDGEQGTDIKTPTQDRNTADEVSLNRPLSVTHSLRQADTARMHTSHIVPISRSSMSGVNAARDTVLSHNNIKYENRSGEYKYQSVEPTSETDSDLSATATESHTDTQLVYRHESDQATEPDNAQLAGRMENTDTTLSKTAQPTSGPQHQSRTAEYETEQRTSRGRPSDEHRQQGLGQNRQADTRTQFHNTSDRSAFQTNDGLGTSSLSDKQQNDSAETTHRGEDRLNDLEFQLGEQSMQLNADVDRLVDILYRKLERKRRIERQRRGF